MIRLKNQSGQGLAGALVAAAIIAVIMLASIDMITNAMKSQKSVEIKNDLFSFETAVRSLLSDAVACTNTFGGVIPSATGPFPTVAAIKDASAAPGVAMWTSGSTNIPTYKFALTQVSLENWVPNSVGNPNGTADVVLYVTRDSSVHAIGPGYIRGRVKIALSTVATAYYPTGISACTSLGINNSIIGLGTTNNLTKWISFTEIGDSIITEAGGNIGIGVPAPTYQLQLSTDSAAKPGTSAWTVASDRRLKNIRAPFTRGLDALSKIQPVYYTYKKNNQLSLPSDKEYVGIIAQDALSSVPEAVTKDAKGFYQLTNDSIFWTLLNSVKQLQAGWTESNSKIKANSRCLNDLQSQISSKDIEIENLKEENKKIRERLINIEEALQIKY